MEKKEEIKKIYYLLLGIYESIDLQHQQKVSVDSCHQFNSLLDDLYKIINDDYILLFKIKSKKINELSYIYGFELKNIINPIIQYIRNIFLENGEYQIAKVGYLYNSIEDSEIKERCGDILLGDSAFDRAINQATQILENRIKIKSELQDTSLIGIPLVSKAIHAKIDETILKFSDKPDIQEGYANLFKGIISIYRNPTHHTLSFDCSREYALKVCAHIDELLKLVEASEKIK